MRCKTVAILVILLGLTGCSEGSDRLSPGTEMMLTSGAKVRVVEDPGGSDEYRNVKVYVLEGANKDEARTVLRKNLKAM
jgi:hypothetical protein